nr:MAG TPA: hypothetical protein [Caudoviricetes sp.]
MTLYPFISHVLLCHNCTTDIAKIIILFCR